MDEPKSLDNLYKGKIFRIPDFQRGYAWKKEQLKDFWEDLVNLSGNRSHYTGLLSLKLIEDREIKENSKEYWLVDDHSYHVYQIIDGQQRLTTFIIFIQAFIEFVRSLPENFGKADKEIYLSESMNIVDVLDKYIYRTKPTGDQFRTYLFGYEIDNPSYDYLRYKILDEPGAGTINETFYTLNLSNAKIYFNGQIKALYENEGMEGLQHIYKLLTKRFLFNEYIIKDEFDVFVMFETMNNRGKSLSDLELLKNRLIYLATLYDDDELDPAERKSLRETINEAWKEVYHQLGRNKTRPLNDDDFLRAHWIMYYKYSRKTGSDYINFLLEEQFSPKKVHKKADKQVNLIGLEEVRVDEYAEELEEVNGETEDEETPKLTAELKPIVIRDFSNSVKESAVHWFTSFYPDQISGKTSEEIIWIDRLNRIGIGYFRPLLMSILKNAGDEAERFKAYKAIERFIFIDFRLSQAMSTHASSIFYNAARELDRHDISICDLISKLEASLKLTITHDRVLDTRYFYNNIYRRFEAGDGYYKWPSLRYLLYEYEMSLLSMTRQKKVAWDDLLRTERDKISIEHIYPQTENRYWKSAFASIKPRERKYYCGSLGNLLLLSSSINSALQNDSFQDKKFAKYGDDGHKMRNGYSDGSHSEIEVAQQSDWGPDQIRERGIKLLRFMEKRWDFSFANDQERERLLFLPTDR
ncbi:MAG TPA: DUF262 domain-containing protein [Anaerolineaceae bacterium]|nr:DUF262 domain-containing protein [Anaerolineaceae bacterium]